MCAGLVRLGSTLLLGVIVLLTITAGSRLHAQTSTGEISVSVTDSSGARIVAAQVVVTGTDTGAVARSIMTNGKGIAEIPLLQPGRYDVRISHDSFETSIHNGITVDSGSVIGIPITLQPGAVADAVSVSSESLVVDTKSSTIAQTVHSDQILALPLSGRNYLDSALILPGLIPSNGTRDNTFNAFGNGGLQNAFLLDGARNTNYLRGLDNETRDMVRPPLDALSSYTVQTTNFSAEYGASAGAIINAITKSGTNGFHGSVYDFVQNSFLNAANYFSKTTAPARVDENQYGGSLGGPILRNKLFFFAAFEGFHSQGGTSVTAEVPTLLQRQGIFGPKNIWDPDSTVLSGGAYVRTQFPNNTIPQYRFNPVGYALLSMYPLPNSGTSDYVYSPNTSEDKWNSIGRVDYTLSTRDNIFARYSNAQDTSVAQGGWPAPGLTPAYSDVPFQGLGIGYTRVISSTTVNEARFNWTTIRITEDGTDQREEVIPGSLDPAIDSGIPVFNVSNITKLGGFACCGNSPLNKTSGVWDMSDNLSMTFGKHVLQTGGEFMLIRPSTLVAGNGRASFGFTGVFTENPSNRSASGYPAADLLLGDADTLVTGTMGNSVERGWYIAGYVQDQWALTANLTLNLGARYEYFAPYTEVSNRMADLVLDQGSPYYGQYVLAGDKHFPRGIIHGDTNNFSPRVGFAYRVPVVNAMSLRGGFGIFYAQDQGNGVTGRMTDNPPFYGYGGVSIQSDQLNPSSGFILGPTATISRPAPISASQFVFDPTATSQLVSWPLHLKMPYVEEWDLSIQKQIISDILLELTYVGNHGVQLIGSGEGNQPTVLDATTVASRRPLIDITDAPINRIGNWNSSNFQGIAASAQKRLARGLQFLNSITVGHAFDIQNPALDLCNNCDAGDTIQNNYDRQANYASSDNDVRFRYVLSGIYDLPFGRGGTYLAKRKVISDIIGGWRLSPIYQYQTGLPFTPKLSVDSANAGTITRPDRVCSGTVAHPTISAWFDKSCFVTPEEYTFGNSGRNILRAPGKDQLNLSIQRIFPLPGHGTKLNLRLDAFNALNHPQFGQPVATVNNADNGKITSASSARTIQLAVRVTF